MELSFGDDFLLLQCFLLSKTIHSKILMQRHWVIHFGHTLRSSNDFSVYSPNISRISQNDKNCRNNFVDHSSRLELENQSMKQILCTIFRSIVNNITLKYIIPQSIWISFSTTLRRFVLIKYVFQFHFN